MPGALKWFFEVVDRVSGPADKMSKSVDRVGHAADQAGKHLDKIGEHAGKFALVTEGVHLAREGIERMIDTVKELGAEILRTADGERTNRLVFESLAGSAAGGAALFAKAEEFASKAGIKLAESMEIFRNLAKDQQLNQADQTFFVLAQAATDLSHRTGVAAASIADSFEKIITKGELSPHELRGLYELGVPVQLLAKHLGVTANNAEELQAAMAGKTISGGQGVQAVVAALQELEGGTIGKLTKSIGEGLGGAVDRLSNAWEKLLGKFGETQGFRDIIKLIEEMTKRLESRDFQKALSDFASSMASVAKSLAEMLPSIATIHDVFGKDKDRLGDSSGKIRQRNEEYYRGKGFFEQIFGDGPNSEASPVDGLDLGLLPGFKGIGTNTIKNVREETGTHSPSTEFMKIGEGWAQGLAIGFSGGSSALDTGSTVSSLGAAGGGHKPNIIHQEIHVHADKGMDLEALARRIIELSAGALQSPLDNLAISIGGI